MRNVLIIDLDTERDEAILIGKPAEFEPMLAKASREAIRELIGLDMATLCEGLVTLIHTADQQGFKPSAESLRDCMKHLVEGFGDAGYTGRLGKGFSDPRSRPSVPGEATSLES